MITTRKVHSVFIHCSASDNPKHDNVSTIRRWHKARGWSDIGYHFVITQAGEVCKGRPLTKIPAAQRGHNRGSVAICLTGKDDFSARQFIALRMLCWRLQTLSPTPLTYRGHCEVSRKTCPVFDYRKELDLCEAGQLQSWHLKSSRDWER